MDRSRFKKPVQPVKKDADPELATAEEAAKFLRLNIKTIQRQAVEGKIAGSKVAGKWRFPWAKLREIAGVA